MDTHDEMVNLLKMTAKTHQQKLEEAVRSKLNGREEGILDWLLLQYEDNNKRRWYDPYHILYSTNFALDLVEEEKIDRLIVAGIMLHDIGYFAVEDKTNWNTTESRITHMQEGSALAGKVLCENDFTAAELEVVLGMIAVPDNPYLGIAIKGRDRLGLRDCDRVWVMHMLSFYKDLLSKPERYDQPHEFLHDRIMNALLTTPAQQQAIFSNGLILVALFFAFAYAVGIVSEYAGEKTFEWLLNHTKRRRMAEYVESYSAMLEHSPIFSSFVQQPKEKRDVDDLSDCIGKMRFFVMSRSAPLSVDIAAQVNRFRVIRVLFLVEVIVLVAIIGQLRYGFTMFWFFTFVLVVCVAIVNFMAIRSRFDRYCRSVERSYIVLMHDQAESQYMSAKQTEET